MPALPQPVSSLQNAGIKEVVKLRQRSHRDEQALLIVEGYREVKRALDNQIPVRKLFFCPALYQGRNRLGARRPLRGAERANVRVL